MRAMRAALLMPAALLAPACAVSIAGLAGCNDLLGIDSARLELDAGDSGSTPAEAGTDPCSNYCSLVNSSCQGPYQQYAFYPQDCRKLCPIWDLGTIPINPPYNATNDGNFDQSGDTTSCRIWHAISAGGSTGNASFHCPHAGPLGGGATFCVAPNASDTAGRCGNFCKLDLATCTGGASAFEGLADCMSRCAEWAYGGGYVTADSAAGNTLNCRLYHLEYAASSYASGDDDLGDYHCGHTADDSTMCQDQDQ
jgi:hypothetical protein